MFKENLSFQCLFIFFSENLNLGVEKIFFHIKQIAGIERFLLVGTDDEVGLSFGVLPTPLDHQKHTVILQEVQQLWHSGLFCISSVISVIISLFIFTFIHLVAYLLFVSCPLA